VQTDRPLACARFVGGCLVAKWWKGVVFTIFVIFRLSCALMSENPERSR